MRRLLQPNLVPIIGDVDHDGQDDLVGYDPSTRWVWARTGSNLTGWMRRLFISDLMPPVGRQLW